MSGFTTTSPEYLIRSELWSSQLKDVLEEELLGMRFVRMLTEFPDGDTFTIPSMGQFSVRDYVEDQSVEFAAADTGEFQFTIDTYIESSTYITKKQMQDSFYASQIMAQFVPKMRRAISERIEADILNLQSGQTASNLNNINGAPHRFVGSGSNETMAVKDFAKALYSLKKANVPQSNLVAIVDPSVEYTLNTLSNLVNVSDNPRWEGLIESGIASGMRFVKNVFGFDVYTSNFLADANETIGGLTTTAGKANLFFSAAGGDMMPFVGAMRQEVQVESEYNMKFQREEYVTTARYGFELYHPENLVTILTDTDQV